MSAPIYTADILSDEWGGFEVAQITVENCVLPICLSLPRTAVEGAAAGADLVMASKFLTAREARLLAAHLIEAAQAAEGAASVPMTREQQAFEAAVRG
ncbi:hypothetical protein GCM10022631_12100 [Deinococcus rubellus]|uniref:Uncharacterized protein n=1 Tax=Deinococcus rubellus TaxID=1889240 RepID=A0ABY5YCG2_9DEIO|nr:hypothetical protein [Deinococcus rubellus]UWX62744.1 hypothetical protein N0D28_08155 [Deinococcus rubellus]